MNNIIIGGITGEHFVGVNEMGLDFTNTMVNDKTNQL